MDMNYAVVDILATFRQVSRRQFTVNAVAYTDRATGGKFMLMPVFSDGPGERQIAEANKETFESLGYTVIPVESRAFEQNGGIHCLITILE